MFLGLVELGQGLVGDVCLVVCLRPVALVGRTKLCRVFAADIFAFVKLD